MLMIDEKADPGHLDDLLSRGTIRFGKWRFIKTVLIMWFVGGDCTVFMDKTQDDYRLKETSRGHQFGALHGHQQQIRTTLKTAFLAANVINQKTMGGLVRSK